MSICTHAQKDHTIRLWDLTKGRCSFVTKVKKVRVCKEREKDVDVHVQCFVPYVT